jgi:hypothetical protein
MNVSTTPFAQVMEFVPWKTFGRIVSRRIGDSGVRTLDCADLFRVMAPAQLTWRESAHDIEACLAANQGKLSQIGLNAPPARLAPSGALNQFGGARFRGVSGLLCVRRLWILHAAFGRSPKQTHVRAHARAA